jgi:signal transduction histidine kinase/CheY-like chemotaxis protein
MAVFCSTANPEQSASAELPPALYADLMDLAYWHEGLDQFARATNLAVVLVDAEGRLLGPVLNPHPLWSLFRQASRGRQPPVDWNSQGADVPHSPCPFCLAPLRPCTSAAAREGGLVIARDCTGLVHVTVPLLLDDQCLGTLLAGQVFDQYPEQLALEQAAKRFGLSPEEVWHLARREHPVKRATLQVYGELLMTLGRTFLLTRYHTLREAERLAEMTRLRDQAVAESTERRRAEEALRDADRRKDEFLAMLAHELRNPLAPALNAVQILKLRGSDQPELTMARDMLERQVRQLIRLVDELLDVSRITSGKIRLQRQTLDMAVVVAHAVETSRPQIEAHRHQLTIDLPPEPLWVDGDLTRLAQVVSNLLNNAAKYTPEGGRIGLTVERACATASGGRQHPDEAVLRVRDNGLGLAADMLPRVFDLFSQAEQSLARAQGGLGIGLNVVRRLVEMHGGSVQATSPGLGQGSEFIVRLLLVPEPKPAESPPKENHARQAPMTAHRVLVVDDNIDAAHGLAMLLRLLGHAVEVAQDGATALAIAQNWLPEIVLLDIGLPGMDGYEVARRLRQQPAMHDALLVALTGYGQEEDRRRSHEAGFDQHLVKPVDTNALQELLARAKAVESGA